MSKRASLRAHRTGRSGKRKTYTAPEGKLTGKRASESRSTARVNLKSSV